MNKSREYAPHGLERQLMGFLNKELQKKIFSLDLVQASSSHQLACLTLADQSKFILKRFESRHWLGVCDSEVIEFGERIAEAVANRLALAVSAKKWSTGQFLIPDLDDNVLLMPFCNGAIIKSWSERQAYQLGKLLASLHQLKLSKKDAKPFPPITLSHESFKALPERLSDNWTKWLKRIKTCNENRDYQFRRWLTSHRDIHAGNVLWTSPDKPILIDWESAGLIHPFVELIGLATNAAGIAHLNFNSRQFTAVLTGYKELAGELPEHDPVLWALCFHSWFLWLSYNLEMNQPGEAVSTLNALNALNNHLSLMQSLYERGA